VPVALRDRSRPAGGNYQSRQYYGTDQDPDRLAGTAGARVNKMGGLTHEKRLVGFLLGRRLPGAGTAVIAHRSISNRYFVKNDDYSSGITRNLAQS